MSLLDRLIRSTPLARSTTPERERLALAIAALPQAQATLEAAAGEVAEQRERLAAVESATNEMFAAEASVLNFASARDTDGPIARASNLIELHATLDRAKNDLTRALARAQGSEEAIAVAVTAESEARTALLAAEWELTAARDAVLFAEYVKPEIDRFEAASRDRNASLFALHAYGYAAWPTWGGGRFKSGEIHGAITQSVNENTLVLPGYRNLTTHLLDGVGADADRVREASRQFQQLAERLLTDADAVL